MAAFYSSADNFVGLIYVMNIFEPLGLSELADTQFWQYET
jgi:hypothetical protein